MEEWSWVLTFFDKIKGTSYQTKEDGNVWNLALINYLPNA